ncbi:hypothetical protein Pint_21844 [Pistacia integerrima]|uniref:Uncharacterized protein n=1 Tax=Pistacia integerrima TaxID=434235 RepID=A0ACC0XER4_9ROSI|nr:hypothetical protein Pint_21844 [Pistacia integerrima]
MAVHPHRLVLMFHILLLLWQIKASQILCPNSCGNVKISYPLGIGEGCYLNKWFEVTCDNSSGSPRAFLNSVHLELTGILHSSSSIIVNFPRNSSINLSGSPFSFSNTDNIFTAIGCENYLNLNQKDSTLSHCHSFCTCAPTQKDDCCDILCTLPRNRKLDNVNMSEIYSEGFPKECSSAFMVHKTWLESNYLKNPYVLKDKEVLPATLEWGKYGDLKAMEDAKVACFVFRRTTPVAPNVLMVINLVKVNMKKHGALLHEVLVLGLEWCYLSL